MAAADKVREAMGRNPCVILIVGGPRSGKTRACTEACPSALWWEISSGPPSMVGKVGLGRFFGPSNPSEEVIGGPIVIDDVDAALAVEGGPRSQGVTSLLSIVQSASSRPVIMTSTLEDPFKILGSSAAGKVIRSSITARIVLDQKDQDVPVRTSVRKKNVSSTKKLEIQKNKNNTLDVLLIESAAGFYGNESLMSTAVELRRILLPACDHVKPVVQRR